MGFLRCGLLAGVVLVGAACGGTAVVESGSGGAGATGSTASSGQGTTTTGPGSSGSSGQTGPSGQTSTGVTTTSTSSGPSDCDGTGVCGDSETGCIQCALQGACASPYDQCLGNDLCVMFAQCLGDCGDPAGCSEICAEDNPEGAILYAGLLDCVVCQQCLQDCAGSPFWDCSVPPPGP